MARRGGWLCAVLGRGAVVAAVTGIRPQTLRRLVNGGASTLEIARRFGVRESEVLELLASIVLRDRARVR